MDEQRALLDQLFGTTRDLSETQKGRVQKVRFSDKEVCKNYLCGLCPYVAFAGTKSDMGKCGKRICNSIDADNCRDEWDSLSEKDKSYYGYERDLLHTLENIVKTCDRKIDKQKQRTDQDMLISQEDVERIFTYHQQISQLLEECEVCGRQGNIDRVYEIMKHVSQLQESVNKIANPPDEKRNIVCEISGNYMSSRDNDERMRAHFEGKQYLGWKLVREKYQNLLAKFSNTSRSNTKVERRADGTRERERDKSRRDRDRSRERGRDRGDWNRSHSTRKDKNDGRTRDRSRDKYERSSHRRHGESRKRRSNSREEGEI